ncbi:DOPA 4,5-dioxygenase family protein [Salinivibrio kushneri]|uniref:DOPA 4,5-dioxygenase family protein n=1 Tax=Salinivibrio kushneri TaxID=1908198 RepID=UPI0022B352D1|nr:DOPA 4,5-dioxygenase family protein [Salinivibrio kushneri]WBA18955.1 DOPA 4,5-dioxygenase family protein [Salinivibrio kushneri]
MSRIIDFPNRHQAYHAHVYYEADTEAKADIIYQAAAASSLSIDLGRFHRKCVGPHPKWSFQIAFDKAAFDEVMAWLEAHRGDLTVFLHGVTGDDYIDHTDHVGWMGPSVELNLGIFKPKQ